MPTSSSSSSAFFNDVRSGSDWDSLLYSGAWNGSKSGVDGLVSPIDGILSLRSIISNGHPSVKDGGGIVDISFKPPSHAADCSTGELLSTERNEVDVGVKKVVSSEDGRPENGNGDSIFVLSEYSGVVSFNDGGNAIADRSMAAVVVDEEEDGRGGKY